MEDDYTEISIRWYLTSQCDAVTGCNQRVQKIYRGRNHCSNSLTVFQSRWWTSGILRFWKFSSPSLHSGEFLIRITRCSCKFYTEACSTIYIEQTITIIQPKHAHLGQIFHDFLNSCLFCFYLMYFEALFGILVYYYLNL